MSGAEASRAVRPRVDGSPSQSKRSSPALTDPLGPILALGRRQLRVAAVVGIAGTLLVHGAPATRLARAFPELNDFSSQVLDRVKERLRSEVDIDLEPPPPPPPPPPPIAPEPEPAEQRAPAPINEPPPAPAQAAKVLTAEPDPDEPVDLTDQGFVTGNADRFAGGITASTGTSPIAVRTASATPGGVPGGKGTQVGTRPPSGKDLSRSASPDTRTSWKDCGFPSEADIEGINLALVELVVRVGADGRAQSVTVLKDPGYGFGKLARACANRKTYVYGLNSQGKPITKTTEPFVVRFTR